MLTLGKGNRQFFLPGLLAASFQFHSTGVLGGFEGECVDKCCEMSEMGF